MFSGTGFILEDGWPAVIYHGQGSQPRRNFIAVAKDRKLSAWQKPYPFEVEGAPEEIRFRDPDCFLIGDWDAEREQFVPESHGRMNWPQEGQSPDVRMFLRDIFAPGASSRPTGDV